MKVLDAKHCHLNPLPTDISNLVKLRHLLVRDDSTHSSINEVGRLKSLQELRRFLVKQDDPGFQLRQLGHLEELRGSLCIDSLENARVLEEADEAKLMLKSHLHKLILCWNNNGLTDDSALEKHVLERLKPSRNLQKLSIIGHRGGTCPSWLGMNLSLSSLKSLCLVDVNWKTFPPIGDLWSVNVPHEKISISIPEKRFGNLRKLELVHLSGLKMWAVHAPCQLFPYLEVLIISDCSELMELSFSHSAGCCQQGEDANPILFSRLSDLRIDSCPQLSTFPPVPWNVYSTISIFETSTLDDLFCQQESSEPNLEIVGKKDTTWNVLNFRNLTGLKKLSMSSCQPLPLCYLQMLSSLRTLRITCSRFVFPFVEADKHAKYQFPVESLTISEWNASGMELTQLLTYFPKLSSLRLWECENLTGLGVNVKGQWTAETPGLSSSANIIEVEQQQGARVQNDVIVASEEAERGLLLLPPQLQELEIHSCPELSLLGSNPHDDSKQDGRAGGGGLRGLTSLRSLKIFSCPKLLSCYSSLSFSSFPFPNALEYLTIDGAVGKGAQLPLSNLTFLTTLSLEHLRIVTEVGTEVLPLSNLTALTSLVIDRCGDLRGEGLLSLLAQGHLTTLYVRGTPNFFVDSDPSQVHEQEFPSCSSKLQELKIQDVAVAGFTTASIRRNLLFSSLTTLEIWRDNKVERFTEEQEALLFVNSLEDIRFYYCPNLQSLPKRLQGLPNLKRLRIWECRSIQMLSTDGLPSSLQELVLRDCPEIQSLPKDGLPSSLQELVLISCPEIQSLPKDGLPDSLQSLCIYGCPAIRSLPKVDDLPCSLRELRVIFCGNEELSRQCHKLINIIPIVIV